jgi:peroxiredoxin
MSRPQRSCVMFLRVLALLAVLATAVTKGLSPRSPVLAGKGNPSEGNFRASDLQGRDIAVSPGLEARCVLLFFCPCGNCRTLARDLRLSGVLRQRPDIRLVGVLHAAPVQARAFYEETGFPGQLLVDEMGAASDQYGVLQCPDVRLLRHGKTSHLDRAKNMDGWRLIERIRSWASSI